jgi:elongation factor P
MNDLKIGSVLLYEDEPYTVLSTQHVQMGRGSAILRTKMKNLITGNVLERTFKHGDKFGDAELLHVKATYLYSDDSNAYFMDSETFDQFPIGIDVIGDRTNFLKEGQEVDSLQFNGKAVNIELAAKVELIVTETVDAVRGDSAQGKVTKDATLENGHTIRVPLFIKQGDKIRINTDTGEYVERVTE